jgi:hypothetical protein
MGTTAWFPWMQFQWNRISHNETEAIRNSLIFGRDKKGERDDHPTIQLYSFNRMQRKRVKLVGLMGCEMLRIPHCADNQLRDGGEVVSSTHQLRCTPQVLFLSLVLISVKGSVNPRAQCGLMRSRTGDHPACSKVLPPLRYREPHYGRNGLWRSHISDQYREYKLLCKMGDILTIAWQNLNTFWITKKC